MMTRRVSLTLAMLAAGTALLATSAFSAPAAGAPKGGTLRMSVPADMDSIDPALAYQPRSWQLLYATCAKLFNYPDAPKAAGTRPVREVVDRYTLSRDRRTYTFDLKRSFRFHTGARVTAQSFADAFNRDAQPELASPAAPYLREIVGASSTLDGEADTISGVRVLSRYRLQIRLTRPVGDFIHRLTMPFFCPVRPSTPAGPQGIDNPAGSGPYYVAERIPNQRIVLKRNPYYRGGRPANVDQVVWTIDTYGACIAGVEQDRIDYCFAGLNRAGYRELADKYGINRPGGRFFARPGLTTFFVAFNHDRPAFEGPGQIPLKKAINHAIDRPEMARKLGYVGGRRTDQMLPPDLARAESIYPRAGADPVAARKLLARASRQPKELVLYADSSPLGVLLAETLVFNLKQIGIDVRVKHFDVNAIAGKVATRGEPFDLYLTGWVADYPDPASFFVPLLGPDNQSGVNLDDPAIDRRVAAASRLTGEARRKAWADLDVDLMRDDPPWAPYVHFQRRTFVSQSTSCVLDHPVYGFDIAAACKK